MPEVRIHRSKAAAGVIAGHVRVVGALVMSAMLGVTTVADARAQSTQAPPPARTAQDVRPASAAAEHIADGNRESAARRTAAAYAQYVAAITVDARNYDALWRAAREAVDLGEVEANDTKRASLYQQATEYAKRAVAVKPSDAEGHFHLSRATGRTALNVSARERVKYAVEVRASALRALELQPRHPGALHVMGVWNAEVMRLNGMARAVAKAFMGGAVFRTASWNEATRYMEQSVAAEPDRLVHLLDLARVYRDTGRRDDARAAYGRALRAPDFDANDPVYRRTAEQELRALK